MDETLYTSSHNETWGEIAKRYGISESELRAANLDQSNFNPQATIPEGIEIAVPQKSSTDRVVDGGGNVVEVDRSQWSDWNIVQGHPQSHNITAYDPASGEYTLRSGRRVSHDQLTGEVLNAGFAGEQIYESSGADPRVELKAIPALFLAESEQDVLEQYWYTQQAGQNLQVTGAMSSFQELYEHNQLQDVAPFDPAQAQQLFINKQLVPTLLDLYGEFAFLDSYDEIDWEAYPNLTQEIYDTFPSTDSLNGATEIGALYEEYQQTGVHPFDDDMRIFISQLIQERGWTGMVSTVSDLVDLKRDWVWEQDLTSDVDIYTDPEFMSPYTLVQEWAQGFGYGYALENGEPPPFLAHIPTREELLQQSEDGIIGGNPHHDIHDPEYWWDYARIIHGGWIDNQQPGFDIYQAMADDLNIDISGLGKPSARYLLSEASLIADIGLLDDLTTEEIAQYVSAFAQDQPEMAETFSDNDYIYKYMGEADQYLDSLETADQVEILTTLDEDQEWQSLLSDIQALPDSIFGVSLGEVKSAFANISQGDVDASEVAVDVIGMNVAETEATRQQEETRQALIDTLLFAASFASGRVSYQVGIGLIDLLLNRNPAGLVAEALPYGLDNLTPLFRGADEVAEGTEFLFRGADEAVEGTALLPTGMSNNPGELISDATLRELLEADDVDDMLENLGEYVNGLRLEDVENLKWYMFDNAVLNRHDRVKYEVWQRMLNDEATILDIGLLRHELVEDRALRQFVQEYSPQNPLLENLLEPSEVFTALDESIRGTLRQESSLFYRGRDLRILNVNPGHSRALRAEFQYYANQLSKLIGERLTPIRIAASAVSDDVVTKIRLGGNIPAGMDRGIEAYNAMYVRTPGGRYTRLAYLPNLKQWRHNEKILVTEGSILAEVFEFEVGDELEIYQIIQAMLNSE